MTAFSPAIRTGGCRGCGSPRHKQRRTNHVGTYTDSTGAEQAFLYSEGSYTTIENPVGSYVGAVNVPYAINDNGQVVGYYTDSTGLTHGFVTSANSILEGGASTLSLADPAGYSGSVYAFAPGEAIDLSSVAYDSNYSVELGANNAVQVTTRTAALATSTSIHRRTCAAARGLWISPHHAMYLGGVLIEAKDLVNGVSIVQAEHVANLEYFHIELETHDVIVVEGALSETFLDDNSCAAMCSTMRIEYLVQLYPETVAGAGAAAAGSRLEDGYEVEAARRYIAQRAGIRHGNNELKIGHLRGFVDPCRSTFAERLGAKHRSPRGASLSQYLCRR